MYSLDQPLWKEALGKAVQDVLMDVCGGEENDEEDDNVIRRAILQEDSVAKASISFPNKNGQEGNKPHDIEIRVALSLFHRFKQQQQQIDDDNQMKKQQLTVVSQLGIVRSFESPHQFAAFLCPLLEERCSSCCHYIQCSSSGIICIVTPQRGEFLRQQLGKLPCPHCIQWCKGEKGLWWHVQQQHGSDHSVATASAVNQRTVLALIPYPTANSVFFLGTDTTTTCNNQPKDDDTKDPLDYIKDGDLEAVEKLVKEGYDPASVWDSKGATPLMWAAGAGHLSLVQYLVQDCHCSPHEGQRGKRSFKGRTPLHWASRNGHLSVVKYLVEQCQVSLEATTMDGTTAFAWASWQAHHDVMKYLCACGADVHTTNSFGCNAVLWCSQGKGCPESMELLRSMGLDMTLVNSNGHGVLHKAAQRGNRDIIQWMSDSVVLPILSGAVGDNNNNKDSSSVDKTFIIHSHLQLIGPDNDGCSPSDLAGMEDYPELAAWIVSEELKYVEAAQDLLKDEASQQMLLPGWLYKKGNGATSSTSTGVNRMKAKCLERDFRT